MEGSVVNDAQVTANGVKLTDDDVNRLHKEEASSSSSSSLSSSSCLAGNNEVILNHEKQEPQSAPFIEQIRQLPTAHEDEEVGNSQQPSLIFVECNRRQSVDDGQRSTVQVLSLNEQQQPPPEILVAYLSGEPEAVAAIELLREAQRIWDQRKRTVTPGERTQQPGDINRQQSASPLTVDVVDIQPPSANNTTATRRYSHEDLRIAYTNISAQLVASERKMMDTAAAAPFKATKQPKKVESQQHYRRRASAQAESLAGQAVARYQHKQQQPQQPSKKNSIPGTVSTSGGRSSNHKRVNATPRGSVVSQQHESDGIQQHLLRPRSSRGSVDVVSQAMTTAGMGAISTSSSRRNSSLTDSAYLKVMTNESMTSTAGRRPSNQRLGSAAVDADVLLPLGSDAVSFHREQRRRASSSKASAIFLLSPTSKEGGGQLVPEPEDEDDNSPEGRRRRRTISIIATVGAFLLVLSILMVTVTLRLATHIDDLGKATHLISIT